MHKQTKRPLLLMGLAALVLALVVGITGCTTSSTTLSLETIEETGAIKVTATNAGPDDQVTSSITIEEGQVLLVSPDLTSGEMRVVLSHDGSDLEDPENVALDLMVSGRVLDTYEMEPGDYTVSVIGTDSRATGSMVIFNPSAEEVAAQDASLAEALVQAGVDPEEAGLGGATNLCGGWQLNTESPNNYLDEGQRELFDEVMANQTDLEGVTINPTYVLADYNVGSTYREAVLCQVLYGSESEAQFDGWYVIVVSTTDDGQTLDSLTPISFVEPATAEESPALPEAWFLNEVSTAKPPVLPEAAQAAFDNTEFTGSGHVYPVALLGTQVVAGTNYLVLAQSGSSELGDEAVGFTLISIYQDLEGNCSINEAAYLDYAYYLPTAYGEA